MIDANRLIRANNLHENPGMIPKKVSFVLKKIGTPTINRPGRTSKMLEDLKKTNETLVNDLKNLNSTTNCLKDVERFNNVSILANELTTLENEVETEKSYLKDLQQQINKLEINKKKIPKIPKRMYQTAQLIDDVKELDKAKERMLEKLRVENIHLGDEITASNELREKIRCMMSERSKFNKEYDELLQKLKSGKQIMQDVVESVKLAEGQRKNILMKIETLNSQEKKQVALQQEEAYSLTMRKVNEQELNRFFSTVLKERHTERSTTLEREISKYKSDETTLNEYRNLMLQLLEKSGEFSSDTDVSFDGIIRKLQKNESDILSLFKYATHLNHQMEVMKDNIVEQGKQINEMMTDQDMKSFRHENDYKMLAAIKEKTEVEELLTKDEIKAKEKLLARLFESISNLIRISGTDVSPLLLLLGENNSVTEFNYKIHMESLETKLIRMIESIPLSSLTSSSLATNVLKARSCNSDSARQKIVSIASKVVITATCQECAAYKKEIEDLARKTGILPKIKVY